MADLENSSDPACTCGGRPDEIGGAAHREGCGEEPSAVVELPDDPERDLRTLLRQLNAPTLGNELLGRVIARVRAEALGEATSEGPLASDDAIGKLRQRGELALFWDGLDVVADAWSKYEAAVRAEAVAERDAHWTQRLDDVRTELERGARHERKLRGELLRTLWRAVHDRHDAPDAALISEDELICAVQDMHREDDCPAAEAVADERQRIINELAEAARAAGRCWRSGAGQRKRCTRPLKVS